MRGLVVGLKDWGLYEDYDSALNASLLGAMILQSTLFALLHYGSPGSSRESLLNLFLGGIAATINVLVAQGHIYLSIGWHFGWNVSLLYQLKMLSFIFLVLISPIPL